MSKTTTVPSGSTFYLQWHVTGSAGGQWNGSLTSGSDGFKSLDKWSIGSGTYTFVFTVKQGSGSKALSKVFMTLKDSSTPSPTSYGARWVSGQANPQKTITITAPLSLTAGVLVTDDPKIQIGSSRVNKVTFQWSGSAWTANGASWNIEDTFMLAPDASGQAVAVVTDQTATAASPHMSAMYLYDATNNVGRLYDDPNTGSNPQTLASSSQQATYTFEDTGTYATNLFQEQSTSGSTTLSSS